MKTTLFTLLSSSAALMLSVHAHCGACATDTKNAEACGTECAEKCDAKASRTALLQGENGLVTTTLNVEGMDCGGCEKGLTTALTATEGVSAVGKVCHKSGKTVVSYDPEKLDSAQLISTIEKSGLKVTGEEVSFNVKGMTCDGCSTGLNAKLTKLDGVQTVQSVSHEEEKAVLTIDPKKTTAEKVAAEITSAGYKVLP